MWSHRAQNEKPWVFTSEDGREHCFARYSAARAFAGASGTIADLTKCAAEYLETNSSEATETVVACVKVGDRRSEALGAAIAAGKMKKK